MACRIVQCGGSDHFGAFSIFYPAAWSGTFHLPGFLRCAETGVSLTQLSKEKWNKKERKNWRKVSCFKSWWHVWLPCLKEWQLWIVVMLFSDGESKLLGKSQFDFLSHSALPQNFQVSYVVWLQSYEKRKWKTESATEEKVLRNVWNGYIAAHESFSWSPDKGS